jgi:hypothetical protein
MKWYVIGPIFSNLTDFWSQATLARAVGMANILGMDIAVPQELIFAMELTIDPKFDDVCLLAQLMLLGNFVPLPHDRAECAERW